MQFTECHKQYGVIYGKAQVNREAYADMLKRSFKGSQAIESIRVLSSLKGVQGKAATQTIYSGNSHSVLKLSGKCSA